MKKKGFTLIELLATIVILGIIALIATPAVLKTLEVARESTIKRSAENYMKAIQYYVSIHYNDYDNRISLNGELTSDQTDYIISNVSVKGAIPEGLRDVELKSGLVNDAIIEVNGYTVTVTNGEVTNIVKGYTGNKSYVSSVIAYEWENATTKIVFSEADDSYQELVLPFSLTINDESFDRLYVQTNGMISLFDRYMENYNYEITWTGVPSFVMMRTDLTTDYNVNSGVFYKFGTEGELGYVVIEYRDVIEYGETTPINFEIKIYSNGTVKMSYKNTDGVSNGLYATSGIFIDFNNYNQYSYNENKLTNNLTVIYELNGPKLVIPQTPESCFEFTAGKIEGYDYSCSRAVNIPEKINGETVTTIGAAAFWGEYISYLKLPSTITSIEQSAFQENFLRKVIIPNGITTITNDSFESNLLTSVTIPNSVTSIESFAFYENLLTKLNIPSGVTSLGFGVLNNNKFPDNTAFIYGLNGDGSVNNTRLISYAGANKTAVIPNNVTTVGHKAFKSTKVINLTIPNSVTTIETWAFSTCDLENVVISNSITNLPTGAFSQAKLTNVVIPSSVTSIGSSAFWGNQLTSVTIPNTVTTIEASAFASNKITSLTIPNTVTTIEASAFASNKITSLTIPNGVTAIGNAAFMSNMLTSLTIPSTVTNIGTHAFNNNQLLAGQAFIYARSGGTIDTTKIVSYGGANRANLVIPNTVTNIGDYAFYFNNITSVTIPSSVTTIGTWAFAFNNLTTATAIIQNTSGNVSLGTYAFNYNGPLRNTTITPTYQP